MRRAATSGSCPRACSTAPARRRPPAPRASSARRPASSPASCRQLGDDLHHARLLRRAHPSLPRRAAHRGRRTRTRRDEVIAEIARVPMREALGRSARETSSTGRPSPACIWPPPRSGWCREGRAHGLRGRRQDHRLHRADRASRPGAERAAQVGTIKVPDERVDALARHLQAEEVDVRGGGVRRLPARRATPPSARCSTRRRSPRCATPTRWSRSCAASPT